VSDVGQSFAVLKLKMGEDELDISVARTERKSGLGHKGFTVHADPFMDKKEACRRRDFTFGAMMMDILTGEILDFFGGREDIKNKIIRHVDANTFVEDSLRVLRACGFAARFNFSIAADTITICKSIDLNDLPAERIREELFKLLLKSENPSIGIWYLMETGANKVIGLQNPSLKALDAAVRINILESAEQRLTLLLAILLENISTALKVLDKLQIFTINGYDVRKQVLLLL
jgi:tRNA nucleotidyltransferase/poly(A) polymerase